MCDDKPRFVGEQGPEIIRVRVDGKKIAKYVHTAQSRPRARRWTLGRWTLVRQPRRTATATHALPFGL